MLSIWTSYKHNTTNSFVALSAIILLTVTIYTLPLLADSYSDDDQPGYSAENPVTTNDQWTPVIEEFEGVEMVLVPAGCFQMGSSDEQLETVIALCEGVLGEGNNKCKLRVFNDEQPQTEICFDQPFWIDRYEVSNGQFAAFNGAAENNSFWGDDELPREQLTWFEARDFCDLREAQLPTEAQWEYAAAGPDSLIFPWGNDFDGTMVNFCDENCNYDEWKDLDSDDGYRNTAPVGTYENSSWVGAYDLSGNVWEWNSTIEEDYPYNADDGREGDEDVDDDHILRGGSFNHSSYHLRTANRHFDDPTEAFLSYGFRCSRPYDE
jgi:formylglycine-generating enzyme required for sulfatase activity